MIEKVYKQTRSGDCADYAMLSALLHIGVDVTEQSIIKKEDLTIQDIASRIIKEGKIKGLQNIFMPGVIDIWLRNGHYIVCGTGKLSFDSVRTFPYLQSFKGQSAHNFCIVASVGDLWKVKDSQGPGFAEGGYWYMKKSDFRLIKKFTIIL